MQAPTGRAGVTEDTRVVTASATSADSFKFLEIVARQREWFARGATRTKAFRIGALRRLRGAIVAERAALVEALHADLRKSPHDVVASEIAFTLAEIDFVVRRLGGWMKPKRRPAPLMAWPASATVVAEPLGVALVLAPWNYPVQLSLVPLVGAVAAGNCVVLKPSELAPCTATVLSRIVASAFASNHVTVVNGDGDVAAELLRERFDKIFFTGSAPVGKKVLVAAAEHLTPVTLELGGKCPCLVAPDADVELAARKIAWGKTLNAGQTCLAPDFVLVDRRHRDAFVDAVGRAFVRFFGDDPRQSRDFGRIVNRRHFDRVVGYLSDGTIKVGGQHDATDLYVAPTVLVDVREDANVMREEIFGPILPVLAYDDVEDALERLKRISVDPLAAYLFTRDRALSKRFVESVRCGGICVNDVVVHCFGRRLPFGGVGASGIGRYHGEASFDAFSNVKTVVRSSARFDLPLRYPPARFALERFEAVVRFLLRR